MIKFVKEVSNSIVPNIPFFHTGLLYTSVPSVVKKEPYLKPIPYTETGVYFYRGKSVRHFLTKTTGYVHIRG